MPTLGAPAARNKEVREGGTSSSPLSTVFPGLGPGLEFAGGVGRVCSSPEERRGSPGSFVRQVAGGMWNAAHVRLATGRTKDSLIGEGDN